MPNRLGTESFENAQIIFRNFRGLESKYNRDGKRNFCVVIDDPARAQQLANDGWNVRESTRTDDDGTPTYYIPVEVSFSNYPPRIVKVTGDKKVTLTEETIGLLDSDDIQYVDLVISPYSWEVNGKSGVKAYVKRMYVVIDVDAFEAKYARYQEEAAFDNDDEDLPF